MNKKYLTWLLRERRIVLIFFLLMYIAVSWSSLLSGSVPRIERWGSITVTADWLSCILMFVLPAVTFAFVHDRRSTDVYFALPVSRREQCISSIVFSAGTNYLYWLFSNLAAWLVFGTGTVSAVHFLLMAGHALLWITAGTVMNAMFFLLANNLFDGAVMVAAWNFFPAAVYLAVSSCRENLIAGASYITGNIDFSWLSALSSGFRNQYALTDIAREVTEAADAFSWLYFLAMLVLAVLGCIGLHAHFVQRKTERAGMISDEIMAYPVVIHVYMILSMVSIASGFAFNLSESIFLWLVLLVIYVTAMFVYKRRIALSPGNLAAYIGTTVLSLALTFAAVHTKGFGIPASFRPLEKQYTAYSYYFSCSGNDLGAVSDFAKNEDYVQVRFFLSVDETEKKRCAPVLEILERNRMANIDAYYQHHDDLHEGTMEVLSYDQHVSSTVSSYREPDARYSVYIPLNEEELKQINEFTRVLVDTFEGEISLDDFLKHR